MFVCCVAIPTLIPYLLWNEALSVAFFVSMFRWLLTWTQYAISNTFAHMYGSKPHDKDCSASKHWLWQIALVNEGNHNFHHTFPFDYRSSERRELLELIVGVDVMFVDVMARLGFAYDLKVASTQLIAKRSMRTGDGSYTLESSQVAECNFNDENCQFEVYESK